MPVPPFDAISAPTQASEAVTRVARALSAARHAHAPMMLNDSARTAQEAAQVLGVALGQIAKSIIFRHEGGISDQALLVITAGDRRVDEGKVLALVGRIGRADAEFVRAATGFAIGDVSPVAHCRQPLVLFDESLRRFDCIWAAAGHPRAVFRLRPSDLDALCPQGRWADVAQHP
jgi:prolyl-tRNA editing enzyme YbaK/EbsC (Cys-tRNA(Pro) deacylase)